MEKTEKKDKPIIEKDENLKKRIEEDFVIHSIPKKFSSHASPEETKKSKTVGIVIFSFGLLILLAAFAFFYYFIFYNQKVDLIVETEDARATSTEDFIDEDSDINEGFDNEDDFNFDDEDYGDYYDEDYDFDDYNEDNNNEDENTDEDEVKVISHQGGSIYKNAPDSDNDGLSDLEEVLLGTDPLNTDTDGDGYEDLTEVLSLYDPVGSGKLETNENISVYKNNIYEYQIHYPLLWKRTEVGGPDSIIFEIGNGQIVQINVQPNIERLDINEWYMEQFGYLIENASDLGKKGWAGIQSEDGLIHYLMHPESDFVFTVNYNIGMDNIV